MTAIYPVWPQFQRYQGGSTRFVTPRKSSESARITSSHDPLRTVIWAGGLLLAVIAATLAPQAAAAAAATTRPFATLAAIILASALAGRLGAYRALARTLIPARSARVSSAAAILAFTALLSGLVNLDVAVVAATPIALHAAGRHGLSAGRLVIAVAMTANAASFLLPTSNITNLLLLSRVPTATLAYLSGSWLPWLLVTAITAGPLAWWAAAGATPEAPAVTGSVATLITLRIARDHHVRPDAWQFTATGLVLVPAQLAAATLGLHLTGVLK